MANVVTLSHVGVDFGARNAGTTAVCWKLQGSFRFAHSADNEDADAWLEATIAELSPLAIYIDAPLSLPAAYHGKGTDYFFRNADHRVRGMSPMFLGGLTARAMRMAAQWRASGIAVHEAYPAALIRHAWESLGIEPRKAIPKHKLRIMAGMIIMPSPEPADRHEADAWLCWVIGHRHAKGEAISHGHPDEGIILI